MMMFRAKATVIPQDITFGADNVIIASNITPYEEMVDDKVMKGYMYDCTVYGKDEYLEKLARENEELKQEIIDTQLALVELYEGGELE